MLPAITRQEYYFVLYSIQFSASWTLDNRKSSGCGMPAYDIYKSWFWPLQFRAMQVLCDTMSRKLSCTPVGYTIERERERAFYGP